MPIIELYPEPFTPPSTTSRLNIALNILPAETVDYDICMPRLKVDGVEIEIEKGSVDESDQTPGRTLNIDLVNLDDAAVFTPDAVIHFGLGKKIAGVWDETTFETLLDDARGQSASQGVGGSPQNPTDRISITIASGANEKLNETSETGLIIYDSNRVTLSDEDFKAIPDKDGNFYSPQVIAVPNLTLRYLFDKVFIEICGFDSYEADDLPLDEYFIDRFDVGMGNRPYDSLKPFIGIFYPAIKEEGNVISVHDTTFPKPAGLPNPRAITVSNFTQLNTSSEKQKLDALLLQYVGLQNNYDYTTPRFEYSGGTIGNSRTRIEDIIIEFRKILSPTKNIIVNEIKNIQNKTTWINEAESEESSEVWEFDQSFEYSSRRKSTQALLPDFGTLSAVLQNAEEEREDFLHLGHPFRPRTKYLARRSLTREGLITVDADNPDVYGDPAMQAAKIAHGSNNTAPGQSYTYGSILAHSESAEPLRDGNVRVHIFETDEVHNLVTIDDTAIRAGEVGMSGYSTAENELLIFAEDNPTRSLYRVDRFGIGPLPLKFGIPLAKRVLVNRQTTNGTVSLTFIGYDKTLIKGETRSVYDRTGNWLGNFVITGRKIDIGPGVVTMNLSARKIASSSEPLQDIDSYAHTMNSGEQEIWTLPINCTDGFVLTTDPHTVPNVGIEARHVGDVTWINLETTDIDLSPWDGLTEDFEFRITPDAVTVPTRVSFDLVTQE